MAGLLLTCGYIVLFLLLIGRLRFFAVPELGRRTIQVLFLLKVAAGTALWWVYTYHYTDRSTADIFKFFDDGNVMFSALPAHPLDFLRMITGIGNDNPYFTDHYYSVMNNWHRRYDTGYYNDAHTMIRYSALVRLFSFGVFHVHTVFSAFLGLLGLLALYKAFIGFVPGMGRLFAAGIFLWPSMLFWASGPIKETLLFLGLGLFLLQFFRAMRMPLGLGGWALMLFGLLIQLGLKSYVLACMLPGLAAWWWCSRTPGRSVLLKFTITHAAAALLIVALSMVSPSLDLVALVQRKQHDMLGLVSLTGPGSFIPTAEMQPGIAGLMRQVPHALYLTFIAPFTMWHVGPLGLVGALENALLLLLFPLALAFARPWREVDLPLLLYCLSFCLLLGLLIGWTTPVVGALMRYRVPLLPFWALASLLIVGPKRIPGWLTSERP